MALSLWQGIRLRIENEREYRRNLYLGVLFSFSRLGPMLSSHAGSTIYRLYSDPSRNRPNTLNALTLQYKRLSAHIYGDRRSVHGSIEPSLPLSERRAEPVIGESVTQHTLMLLQWWSAPLANFIKTKDSVIYYEWHYHRNREDYIRYKDVEEQDYISRMLPSSCIKSLWRRF